ncbi:hypothetical protein [Streptomyces nitrosporeus]|uniref:hypothetical protein n=1 Tax=Streptomyces nitrosporeus TaxID=28894 RepID=UPI0039A2C5A5
MHGTTAPRPTGPGQNTPGTPGTPGTSGAPAIVYDTEIRHHAGAHGGTRWQKAERLTVRLDRGEPSDLVELAWRSEGGAEATVVFDEGMTAFRGHRRTTDGTTQEYRGTRRRYRTGADEPFGHRARVFATETEGPHGPAAGGTLRLVLDDGGAPVERISWRDRQDTSISVVLRSVPPAGGTVPVEVAGVAANDEYRAAGEVAANVLHSGAGKWLARTRRAWLEFTLPGPAAVTAYTLTSANDHCARDPRDWVLEGSADGRTWTALDRRTDEIFPGRFLVREFGVAAPAAYPVYRLRVTRNEGDVGEVQLNRVQLLVKHDHRFPDPVEFHGFLRPADGPAVGYRGRSVTETADLEDPDTAPGEGGAVRP